MPSSRIAELAQMVAKDTAVVEKYYTDRGLPLPSFEVGALVDPTIRDDPEAESARVALIGSCLELHDLVQGPVIQVRPWVNAADIQIIYRFDLPAKVPIDGEISYSDLGALCGLEPGIVQRIIRYAIAHHRIFCEKREGYVSHSAASYLLATSEDARAAAGFMYDEVYTAFSHNADVLQRTSKPNRHDCAWTAAHLADVSMFEYAEKHPGRPARISKSMRQLNKGFGQDLASLLYGVDWAMLESQHEDPLVVDIGGANGHASMGIAQLHPKLRFEVQDLPKVVEAAQGDVPPDLKDRVTFRAHNFQQAQPTQADVYFIRKVLHNWSDDECVGILKALVPALKAGARVIINEALISRPGEFPLLAERYITYQDMVMLTVFGSKERDSNEWKRIFNRADARFTNFKAVLPPGCCLAIIEATWQG